MFRRKPRRARVDEQKRSAYRAAVEFPLLYVMTGRRGTREALAGELSAGGLRMIGDEDLPEGTMLELRFTLPAELVRMVQLGNAPPAAFAPMQLDARVVVAFFDPARRKFAHGVKFVSIDERAAEELQRFIHAWQLRVLRERADQ